MEGGEEAGDEEVQDEEESKVGEGDGEFGDSE
jgi:hypothetical protein